MKTNLSSGDLTESLLIKIHCINKIPTVKVLSSTSQWSNGETTDEPLSVTAVDASVACAIHAKEKNILHLPGWRKVCEFGEPTFHAALALKIFTKEKVCAMAVPEFVVVHKALCGLHSSGAMTIMTQMIVGG